MFTSFGGLNLKQFANESITLVFILGETPRNIISKVKYGNNWEIGQILVIGENKVAHPSKIESHVVFENNYPTLTSKVSIFMFFGVIACLIKLYVA